MRLNENRALFRSDPSKLVSEYNEEQFVPDIVNYVKLVVIAVALTT